MKLELIREDFTEESTIGRLLVDGIFNCFVLEDKVRMGEKIYGKTAIPYGTYKVVVTYSPRFKVDMPLLLNVKGFEGVRIHYGNYAKDTEGCLIVGLRKGKDMVLDSKKAYSYLFNLLKSQKDITLVISQKQTK